MYDGLYTFAVRLLNIGMAAGLTVLTARMLGPSGRGTYALPGVEAALVASAFGGLSSATSYFFLNRNASRQALWPVFGCTALLTAIAAGALFLITHFTGQQWAAPPAAAVLPSLALLNVATGYAIGVKRVRFTTTLTALQTFLTIAAIGLSFVFFAKTPDIAIAAWIGATGLAALIATVVVLADSRTRLTGTDRVSFLEYLRFCARVSAVYVVSLLNYRVDLYIVALFLPAAALGMYGIAVSAAESLLVPTQVAALVTSPHLGGLDLRNAALLTARCVRNNLLVALAVCVPLFIFAGPLIGAVYGRRFLPLVPAFDVLLIGVLALSLSSPISSYFTLKLGRPQVAFWLASLSAVICIGTTLAVIHRYGMVGAALGSTAGYVAGQALALLYFGRVSGLGWREMLVPTGEDFSLYASFAGRLLRDGRRLLRPVH